MERQPHRLRPNKAVELPSRLFFVDVETKEKRIKDDVIAHELVLGWCIFWKRRRGKDKDTIKYYYFEDDESFWDFVFSNIYEKERAYLISHNITFDFTVLKGFKHLVKNKWEIRGFYNENQSTILRFRNKKKTLIVLDNLNFFRVPLEVLGKEIGYKKGKVDFKTVSKEELKEYCKRDTEILLRAWQKYLKYLEDNNLGNFAFTTPGQAFTTYRHRFMKEDIYIHDKREALELERNSYFGGRVECFYIGHVKESPIYVLDVNSMYPYVMKKYTYPTRFIGILRNPSLMRTFDLLDYFLLCAHVVIETDKPFYPVRVKGKLIFPTGKFETYLCSPELFKAFKEGHLKEVKKISIYERKDIFSAYVDYFYEEKRLARAKGDKAKELFSKLMMNSLYGKFGQKRSKWRKIGKCEKDKIGVDEYYEAETGKKYLIYYFAGYVWEVEKEGETWESFPAIAAHVTSYARLYLLELMEKAGFENVYYCDTDSIFVNKEGFYNVKDYVAKDELGKLSLKKVVKNLVLYGCKDYEADGEIKQKGRRKDAVEIAPGKVRQLQWSTFRTLLRQEDVNTYIVKEIVKEFKREYDKGEVSYDGRVNPFHLPYTYPGHHKEIERAREIYQRELEGFEKEELKRFRKVILELGGVNDSNYKYLPKWCIRKSTGRTLDDLVTELASYGYYFEDANELYDYLVGT